MNPRRALQAQKTRQALDEYLDRFELEVEAESCPRHLENVAMACSLLLDWLELYTGKTQETAGYARRIGELTARAVELWAGALARVTTPGRSAPVRKARPRLRLVPGGGR